MLCLLDQPSSRRWGQLAVAAETMRADCIVYRTLTDTSSLGKIGVEIEKIEQHLAVLSSRMGDPADQQRLEASHPFGDGFQSGSCRVAVFDRTS